MTDVRIKTEIVECLENKYFKKDIAEGEGWTALCFAAGYLEVKAPEVANLLNAIIKAGAFTEGS